MAKVEKHDQNFWYVIPAELVESGKPAKAILYGLISSLTRRGRGCTASNEYLAGKLNRKDHSVIRTYISELIDEGWIVAKNRGGRNRVLMLAVGSNPWKNPREAVEKTTGQPVEKTTLSNINLSSIKSNSIDIENFVKALKVLGINSLTEIQEETIGKLIDKYPSRDYEFQALKCRDWWDSEKGGFGKKPLLAFANWLTRSKVDDGVIKRKADLEEQKKANERNSYSGPVDSEGQKKVDEQKAKIREMFRARK